MNRYLIVYSNYKGNINSFMTRFKYETQSDAVKYSKYAIKVSSKLLYTFKIKPK